MSHNDSDNEKESGAQVISKEKIKRPALYKVLLHNDDYTTMEFVIVILSRFFGKSLIEAQAIMLKVHHEGVGVCGLYTKEVAETKVTQVLSYARESGHPLKCTCEPE